MAIKDLITAAEAEQRNAEALPDTDTSKALKVAEARAKVAGLKSAESAGYTFTQGDVDSAVTTRLPDAQGTGRTEERKALAQKLGVKLEDLDAEVNRLAGEKRSGESQADQERRAKEAAERERDTAGTERDSWKGIAEQARDQLAEERRRTAVEAELRNLGVIITKDHNYLPGAYNLADKSSVQANVEIDPGTKTLVVKGAVTGAKEAAEKVKQHYPAMFGEPPPDNPRQGPERQQQGGSGTGEGSRSYAQQWGSNLGPRREKEGATT